MAESTPSAGFITKAVTALKDEILGDLDNMTMKKARGLLEKHLQLAEGALKPAKDLVSKAIDQLIVSSRKSQQAAEQSDEQSADSAEPPSQTSNDEPARPKKKAGHKKGKQRQRSCDASEEDSEEDSPPKKRNKKQRPTQAAKPQAAAAGSKSMDPKLEALKAVCGKAGIKVPPNIYKKDGRERVAAVGALLDKHGLSGHSTPAEITAVKKRLEKEKALEGIALDNIVSGPRRSRPTQRVTVSYTADIGSDDSDAETKQEESDDDASEPIASEDSDHSSGEPSAQQNDDESAQSDLTNSPVKPAPKNSGPAERSGAESLEEETERKAPLSTRRAVLDDSEDDE